MELQVKQLEEELLSAIAQRITVYGFRQRGKSFRQDFVRTFSLGKQVFHVGFIAHDNDFDVTADVAIRFDELEDLVNQAKEWLSNSHKKETHSIGAELSNISELGQMRSTVASSTDINPVADSLMRSFNDIGLPYLEKYSDMNSALDALQADNKEAWLHSPFHVERAMKAIGLAFLLGNQEKFKEIATRKTEFLSGRGEPGIEPFLRLKSDLKDRS